MQEQNEQAERQVYESILGLPEEWVVEGVEQNDRAQEMTFKIVCKRKVHLCPRCGAATVLYGTRERTIRHLDMCAYKTFLLVQVPRIKCPEHGVMAVAVPFAGQWGHFTYGFANRILELCRGATIKKVADDYGMNWHVIAKLKARAGRRAPARYKIKNLTVDETSFRKHHDYSTIFTDAGVCLPP